MLPETTTFDAIVIGSGISGGWAAMLEACAKAGVLLMYAEELFFAPKYVKAKQMADEGAFGRVHPVKQSEKHSGPHAEPSCHAFSDAEIVGQLDGALSVNNQLRHDAVWFPDPADPAVYDSRIAGAGGIDCFLLASGAGDGHVAFNPPGSALSSGSRIVTLSEQTRRDNLLTFPALGALEHDPRYGVSVGIATIVAAREAVMVAWGEGKQETVARMRAATHYDPAWPATLIHECARGEILIDRAADGASV